MQQFIKKLINRFHKENLEFMQQSDLIARIEEIVYQEAEEYIPYSFCRTREFCDYQFLKDDGWIPCNERLPKLDTEVKIKFDNGTEFQGGMDKNGWYVGSKSIMFDWFNSMCLPDNIHDIVAWQPLTQTDK